SFNRAKELVSNSNISTLLKKHSAFKRHNLSKNIFDSVRLNINSDNYSIADLDSSSNAESDYDDERVQSSEVDND
ncbi:unnamed protein product, partial [Rotaria sordida]